MWTWLRDWLFVEASAIVRAGRARPLTADDAPPLTAELTPVRLDAPPRLSLASFWPALLRLFFGTGRPARVVVALTFARLGIATSTPVLLHEILRQLPAATGAASFPWKLLGLAALLGSAVIVSALLTQHWYHAALRIRTCMVNVLNPRVVAHALDLRRSARASMETGDLINHLGSDTDAIAEAGFFLPEGFHSFLTIVVALIVLVIYLGWAALASLAALVVLTPFTTILARRFRRLDEKIMGIRDKRATLMSQIVHGIRVVKYHAWEPSVSAEVQALRGPEVRTRIGIVASDVLASAIWVSTATVVAFSGFGAYVLLGGELSAPLVFACLALFQMLEEPFGLISHILARLQHARVASSRLESYFAAPERGHARTDLVTGEPQAIRCADIVVQYAGAPQPALELAALEIQAGESVAIVGPLGSGKSTLLRVLGGIQLPARGEVAYLGEARARIAFVPQEAFTLNASLRANIEFGSAESELLSSEELDAIIRDCALVPDLAAMPAGLDTEIGERGVNLSGGQKQRVALARAAYHRPGIVLLDDPLSAVDVHTEDLLVERLLFGRLREVTRVVVTHRLTHLSHFDRVIFVSAGRVVAHGHYDALMRDDSDFRSFCTTTTRPDAAGLAPAPEPHPVVSGSADANAGRVTEDEDRATGAVRWPVYRDYLGALVGDRRVLSALLLAGLLLSVALVAVLPLSQRIWFARFTDHATHAGPQSAVLVYGAIGLAVLIASILQRLLWLNRAAAAGRTIHDRALSGLLGAPLRFFDSTPTGRILNRFARDLEVVDDELSWSIEAACRTAANTVAMLVLIVSIVPIVLIVALPVVAIYYQVQHAYRRAARESRRLESVARSPRYAQFKEIVTGLDVIHAFGRERYFLAQFYTILEHYTRMHWCSIRLNRWFGTRMGLIGGTLSLGTCMSIVLLSYAGGLSAGMAGLVLSYALGLWGALNWAVRALSEVETYMTQAERLQHYARLTAEPLTTTASELPATTVWPQRGAIEFRDVAARYAPHLPRVLDGVTFHVAGGSKVGVIGRTGAGKSTLFQAMFRFLPLERGAIFIDGVDIASIPLPRLRSALAIIPQDPTLFAGSVRANLDRFGTCSDAEVWAALRRVHLDGAIHALPGELQAQVTEHGHNFSQGQRQLLCMARAILTRAKVIVLDEATASVDVRTDRSIQETVRAELRGMTVLVIAHRLDTIADADLILELAHGRVVRSTDRISSIPVRRRESRSVKTT